MTYYLPMSYDEYTHLTLHRYTFRSRNNIFSAILKRNYWKTKLSQLKYI